MDDKDYLAHKNETEIQTVKEHSESVARLCEMMSVDELKDLLYMIGRLHDIGKYQETFQKRIRGADVSIEHSICGAKEALTLYEGNIASLIMAYCIAGHHGGIPNGGLKTDTPDISTLQGRLKRETETYTRYEEELSSGNREVDKKKFVEFLSQDCSIGSEDERKRKSLDKFAFIVRYCFSCLVDADSLDTAEFCTGEKRETLKSDFPECLKKINDIFEQFVCQTELQKTREVLQKQAFENLNEDANIYLLNMPTGSGKTLCSVKCALEQAIKRKKRRIIYVIPYNSIIDQTVNVFENIFGASVNILRHQSTFSVEDKSDDEDYIKIVRNATENWDAEFIVTTAVQFFETLYSNKRSKLRKLHNMSDSVIIFDEAHMMPEEYLQPCLEALVFLSKYFNSDVLLMSATLPDYKRLLDDFVGIESNIKELIIDKSSFKSFEKCTFHSIGETEPDKLLEIAEACRSSLIVVNNKKTAQELYRRATGKKFHLSTYMTAKDRERVIREIKEELKQLETDYPRNENVPIERKITVISTSLIEAGVDLDFHTVFRELAGLDNILQTGGRCNREGKRKAGNVFVFEIPDKRLNGDLSLKAHVTKQLIKEYENIMDGECIKEYYDKCIYFREKEILRESISYACSGPRNIPFADYEFKMIKDSQVSVVIPDSDITDILEEIKTGVLSTTNMRKIQKNTVSVYEKELDDLKSQHAVHDYGNGIFILDNMDYYVKDVGIQFEPNDYIL